MLSPVGVPEVKDQFVMEEEKKILDKEQTKELKKKEKKEEGKRPPKILRKIAMKAWKKKWSPFGIMRSSGNYFAKKMIKKYMARRMGSLP